MMTSLWYAAPSSSLNRKELPHSGLFMPLNLMSYCLGMLCETKFLEKRTTCKLGIANFEMLLACGGILRQKLQMIIFKRKLVWPHLQIRLMNLSR